MKVIIFLVISALVIWFVYWLVDSSGSRQFGYGVVVGKKFTKGYWQTRLITTLQTDANGVTTSSMHPQTTWIPDSYVLRIHVADDIVNQSVSKMLYESIEEGENIPVEYSRGRLSDKVYIKKVGNDILI
ncbi:hypothetical protein [Nostoc sp.]|uniref:hypothetical protein n=1 Tax=Nostoc sp. TaxID=1180 RepID=UPI002FFB289D